MFKKKKIIFSISLFLIVTAVIILVQWEKEGVKENQIKLTGEEMAKKIEERLMEVGYIETDETKTKEEEIAESGLEKIQLPETRVGLKKEKIIVIGLHSGSSLEDEKTNGFVLVIYPERDFHYDIIRVERAVHHATLIDLTGDGKNELALATYNQGRIFLLKPEGAWKTELFDDLTEGRIRKIAIGDVDGDGEPELAVSTHSNGWTVFYKKIGDLWQKNILDKETFGKDTTENHDILIGDFDNDGQNEILAASSNRKNPSKIKEWAGVLKVFKFASGKWNNQIIDSFKGGSSVRRILFDDIDNDGKKEIIALVENTKENKETRPEVTFDVILYKFKNSEFKKEVFVSNQKTGAPLPSFVSVFTPLVDDIDNDGKNEFVVMSFEDLILFKDGKSKIIDQLREPLTAGFLYDLNGNGTKEIIVFFSESKILRSYEYENGSWQKKDLVRASLPDSDLIVWSLEVGEIGK